MPFYCISVPTRLCTAAPPALPLIQGAAARERITNQVSDNVLYEDESFGTEPRIFETWPVSWNSEESKLY